MDGQQVWPSKSHVEDMSVSKYLVANAEFMIIRLGPKSQLLDRGGQRWLLCQTRCRFWFYRNGLTGNATFWKKALPMDWPVEVIIRGEGFL